MGNMAVEFMANNKIKIGKNIFVLLAFTTYLSANSDVCSAEWVLSNGMKVSPSSSLKTFKLIDSNDMNSITMKTQNYADTYQFNEFIDLHDGRLGVSYRAPKGTLLLDRFTDGTMFLWNGNVQILKAKCPRIEIGKLQK